MTRRTEHIRDCLGPERYRDYLVLREAGMSRLGAYALVRRGQTAEAKAERTREDCDNALDVCGSPDGPLGELKQMRLKNIWLLCQTTIATGVAFPDTPEVWARLAQQRLEGTMVTLVDVSDAMAASLRSSNAEDLGPMGKVAFRVTQPGDMDLPTFRVPEGEGTTEDVIRLWGDDGSWEPLLEAMSLLGVSRDAFLRLPTTLALQLAQLSLSLAKLKAQAQEARIPVGYTVGPIYWEGGEANG